MAQRSGQCLCGAVTYTADVSGEVNACHCGQCQRWAGGGPYFAARADNILLDGGDVISAYHASAWGERAVCGTCGTTLYWTLQDKAPRSVAAGTLNDQSELKVTSEIFVDHRAPWMPPFEGATQSTEAEVIAEFQASAPEAT